MTKADKTFDKKVRFLAQSLARLERRVSRLERQLIDLILNKYIPRFETEDNLVIASVKNRSLITEIDSLFLRFARESAVDVVSKYALDLTQLRDLNIRYFVDLGFEKDKVTKAASTEKKIRQVLGVTPTGRVKKGSFLSQLSLAASVKEQLKDYIVDTLLLEDVPMNTFIRGFRDRVLGADGGQGALSRYYTNFAYDRYREIDELTNDATAEGLELIHFQYLGGVIETTRPFCRKRNGKVFSVAETKDWKNDPDLIDKKTRNTYDPLTELGRYRCRHYKKYITQDLYEELKENE